MSVVKTVGNAIKEVAEPLNAGVSVFNGINSSIQAHKNRDAQREANYQNMQENQLNRDFNAQQADLQRQWSAQQSSIQNAFNADQAEKAFQRSAKFEREMLERESELNSPNNMLKQYQEAGFNPNLFGGQIPAASAGSASSPSAQGSNPSGASASAGSSIPVAPVTYSNPMFEAAQIRLANAQASNLESKTKTENATRDGIVRLNDKQYQLWDSQIPVNDANAKYLNSVASKCDSEIKLINEQISQIQANVKLIDKQGQLLQKDIDSYAEKLQSALIEAASRTNLNLVNAKVAASQIALNSAYAQQAYANASLAGAQAEALALPNFMNGLKLEFFKDNRNFALSFTEDSVMADYSGYGAAKAHNKREGKQALADEKMIKYENDDILAFLRAFGSVFNLSVGGYYRMNENK